MEIVDKLKAKIIGEWQPTQVFDAGYTRWDQQFLDQIDDYLRPDKGKKRDYKLKWRTGHWELRANRLLTDEELATLRRRYDDSK